MYIVIRYDDATMSCVYLENILYMLSASLALLRLKEFQAEDSSISRWSTPSTTLTLTLIVEKNTFHENMTQWDLCMPTHFVKSSTIQVAPQFSISFLS